MNGLLAGALGAVSGGASQYIQKLKEEAEAERQKALEQTRFDNNATLENQRQTNRMAEAEFTAGRNDARSNREIAARNDLADKEIASNEKIAGMKSASKGTASTKLQEQYLKEAYEIDMKLADEMNPISPEKHQDLMKRLQQRYASILGSSQPSQDEEKSETEAPRQRPDPYSLKGTDRPKLNREDFKSESSQNYPSAPERQAQIQQSIQSQKPWEQNDGMLGNMISKTVNGVSNQQVSQAISQFYEPLKQGQQPSTQAVLNLAQYFDMLSPLDQKQLLKVAQTLNINLGN